MENRYEKQPRQKLGKEEKALLPIKTKEHGIIPRMTTHDEDDTQGKSIQLVLNVTVLSAQRKHKCIGYRLVLLWVCDTCT